MGDIDQAARYTAKLEPVGFFRWLLPRLDLALIFHDWLDTRTLPFPGEPDRTCDTVAGFHHATDADRRWGLVAEFQAEPEADMLDRLLEYLARLRRELRHGPQRRGKYAMMAVLLNLTGPAQEDTLDMRLAGLPECGLWLRPRLMTLREEDAALTLQGIVEGRLARCVLPWLPLMHGATEASIMEQWMLAASAEPSSRLRDEYAGLALVFAELTGTLLIWRKALEGWNMRQSQIVLEWKTEAKIERARADVLRVLQLRFRTEVPADLTAAVESLTDLDELSNWLDAAVTSASLEAFRAAVRQ